MRSFVHRSASRSVGIRSVSISTPWARLRLSILISSSVRSEILALLPGWSRKTRLKLVVRRTFPSWHKTRTLSLVRWMSISTISASIAITLSIAGMEFSGQLRQSPRWTATTTYLVDGSCIWAAIAAAREGYCVDGPGAEHDNRKHRAAITNRLFLLILVIEIYYAVSVILWFSGTTRDHTAKHADSETEPRQKIFVGLNT